MLKRIIFFSIVIISFYACTNDELVYKTNDELIQEFLLKNNINDTIADPSGLYLKIIETGLEEGLPLGDIMADTISIDSLDISVTYTGYLLGSGQIIDQSTEEIEFQLSDLIGGWIIGIPYLRKGGRVQLFIPSYLGYGTEPIWFDLTLVDFTFRE